jgi:tRNA dimethylallyltransferase
MWLAARHDVLIVSADSRQVYRGFDVGTSKPSVKEREAVPHRGVDVADPRERYSAAAWSEMARAAISEADTRGKLPLIVGGTGFYISSLFQPLWEEPDLDPKAREAIQAELAEVSTAELRRWCATLDQSRSHLGRAQLLRAVEVALLTGQRVSDMHRTRAKAAEFSGRYIVVDPGADLATRIATRANAMFDSGWTDEVERLIKDVPSDAPAWNASGYGAVRRHVEGTLSRNAAIENVIIETRQYAKRQRTWFRNQLNNDQVLRLDPQAPGWEDAVEQWFGSVGSSILDPRSP